MANKSLDGNLIKKAHKQQRWTEKDIMELAKCQDPVNGPYYFLNNYYNIQHPTKGQMRYTPYEYQDGLIEAMHNHRFTVAMLGRQLGKCVEKTTLVSVRDETTQNAYKLPIYVFHEYTTALKMGTTPPDISPYQIK